MRPDAALADRRREVRIAARGWRRKGPIDEPTLHAIEAAYPDDRARLGPMFRALAFVLGWLALNAFFGLFALLASGARGFATACLVFSMLLVAATEVLRGRLRRADSGIETATALLAVVYALVGIGIHFERLLPDRAVVGFVLAVAVVLSLFASARWGSPLLAAFGGVALLIFLARLPAGRLLWLLACASLAPLLLRASESRSLPPVHRRSFLIGLLLAIGAFYVAVHVGSWDYRWLEWIADFGEHPSPRPGWARPLSILATAIVPLAVIAFGVLTRRAPLLDLGVLLGVASLMTLRFYVHVAPAWVVLVASGVAALLLTLALRRLLASAAAGERAGFTAEPLFEDPTRRHATEIVGAMATFAPQARTIAPADTGMKPGGGSFGGGGATSDF